MTYIERAMQVAIDEAKQSLRECNHGFGAVVIKDNEIISQAHDEEETRQDCTSHAEINAIRNASSIIGKDLSGCTIVSTHEPCPMCASAIVWSGISQIAFGYSIDESIEQGRKRIALNCEEIFNYSGKQINITSNVLYEECKLLYMKSVRSEIKRLRNTTEESLRAYNEESKTKRLEWFKQNKSTFEFINQNKLEAAYFLLLHRFGINEKEAPIIERSKKQVVFHSMNFCPTLEACKILDLDTIYICQHYNEESTNCLIKQIDQNLSFKRNYKKIRPYTEYCEELIVLEDK
jgi:tRNA(adenine34) deaminase